MAIQNSGEVQVINKTPQPEIDFNVAQQFLCNHYIDILQSRDAKIKTINQYLPLAEEFIHYLNRYPLNVNSLINYKRDLERIANNKKTTKSKRLTVAKMLLEYLFRKGITKIDLTYRVKNFTKNKEHKRDPFSPGEIMDIKEYLDLLPDYETTFINRGKKGFERRQRTHRLRKKVMFQLMAFRGLRIFEIVPIEYENINFQRGYIEILGKKRDEPEKVFVQSLIIETIKEYLNDYDIRYGYIFPSRQGNFKHITTRRLQQNFKAIFEHLKIENGCCHRFRHYFVTDIDEACGGDQSVIMALARFKTAETLSVYSERRRLQKEFLPHLKNDF